MRFVGKAGPGIGMALALLPALAVHIAALTLTTATARPHAGGGGSHTPSAASVRFVVASAAPSVPARPDAAEPVALETPEVPVRTPASRAVNGAEPAAAPTPTFATESPAEVSVPAAPGIASAEGPGVPLDYLPRAMLSVAPQPLAAIDIPFPPAVQGSVNLGTELALFIDEAGTVRHVRIDGAPLPPALEEAARTTFLNARFTPGELNGAPVRSLIRVAIRFDTDLPTH